MVHALVSTDWLGARLGDPTLRILDASWYLPSSGRDAHSEFLAGHLPGAAFVNLEAVSHHGTNLPHMLPDPAQFARQMEAVGVDDDSVVVVYDGSGVNLSAPRIWWMLRAFGHAEAAVLDGGRAKWQREGRLLESGERPVSPARGHFTPQLDQKAVRDLAAMTANLKTGAEQVVDARAAGRFTGDEPEPRPGMRGGHIPGSRNVPFTDLVDAGGTLLSPELLRARFHSAGIDLGRPVVTSCGSGVTACALALGLEAAGHPVAGVYDGSWSEWGGRTDTPVETGPAR